MTEGVRISDLTAAAALTGVEEIAAVQSSATVKATADQIALYAREYASRVRSVSADYTITGRTDSPIVQVTAGATDRTITLPDGSTLTPGDEFEVAKIDSGTGKVTVSRAGTDTIDGVTSVDVDSQYDRVRVRWTGTFWTIVDYKDHGSNANGEWVRYADGTMVCRDSAANASHNYTSSGALYLSPVFTHTFAQEFVAPPLVVADTSGDIWASCRSASTTTTQATFVHWFNTALTGRTDPTIYVATGRWRA